MRLLTGSGGQLGRLVIRRLEERQLASTVGSRHPTTGQSHLAFDGPETLGLQGVTSALMISAGYGEDDVVIRRHDDIVRAAERAAAPHVVYTSLTGAGDHLGFAFAHQWTERRLRASGLSYTILHNGLYSELIGELTQPAAGVITTPTRSGSGGGCGACRSCGGGQRTEPSEQARRSNVRTRRTRSDRRGGYRL